MKLKDFIEKGLTVINYMGEIRKTTESSIVFPNGRVASIVKPSDGSAEYSVAVCDYNGYFDWNTLRPFGTDKGVILCDSEEEVCKALIIIEMLGHNRRKHDTIWIVEEKNGEVYKVNSKQEKKNLMERIGGCFTILDHEPTSEEIDKIVISSHMNI